MTGYTKERVTRNRFNVFKNGEFLCQLTAREVDGWIARAERNDAEEAVIRAEIRATRVELAQKYLKARAARAPKAVQLVLF